MRCTDCCLFDAWLIRYIGGIKWKATKLNTTDAHHIFFFFQHTISLLQPMHLLNLLHRFCRARISLCASAATKNEDVDENAFFAQERRSVNYYCCWWQTVCGNWSLRIWLSSIPDSKLMELITETWFCHNSCLPAISQISGQFIFAAYRAWNCPLTLPGNLRSPDYLHN